MVVTVPFGSTRVVHSHWAAHHASVTEGAMGATCEITHGGTPSDWDPKIGPTPGTPAVTYSGPCRIQYAATDPRDTDAADQSVTERVVLVVLPRSAATQPEGARVRITAVDTNGLAALLGRVLTVRSVGRSSLAFEQDLTCTDDQDNQPEV